MPNPNIPSKEELQADIDNATKALEAMENIDQIPDPEDDEDEEEQKPPVDETPKDEEKKEDVSDEEIKEDKKPPQEEEKKEDKPPVEEEKTDDYEKKFKESTREAQKIATEKKKLEAEIDDAYLMPEPDDEQLKQVYANWDELSEFEKQMAKDTLHNKNIANKIKQVRLGQKEQDGKIDDYVKRVDVYSIEPETIKKFPLLEGRQEELKEFAALPERITLPLDDLVQLFLVKNVKPVVKHKGKMFETGQGGDNKGQDKSNGMISLSEANDLMSKDYNKYKEYLKAGKIDFNTI